ncbi:hypothetical protein BaRGS_00019173 [Batillaria attramentaria]|uniref:Uncharacterized protein n=1 Tax=Batillaria attramentaria TaxID=370345 RepID=A0ABD0KQU6_9CAEN
MRFHGQCLRRRAGVPFSPLLTEFKGLGPPIFGLFAHCDEQRSGHRTRTADERPAGFCLSGNSSRELGVASHPGSSSLHGFGQLSASQCDISAVARLQSAVYLSRSSLPSCAAL